MDNYLIEIIDRIGKKIETSPLKKRTHYVIDGEVLYLDEVNHQDHTTLWSYKEYEVKIWYHGGETARSIYLQLCLSQVLPLV